jgi:hypothetical protein
VISHFGKMTEKNDLLSLMRGIKLESWSSVLTKWPCGPAIYNSSNPDFPLCLICPPAVFTGNRLVLRNRIPWMTLCRQSRGQVMSFSLVAPSDPAFHLLSQWKGDILRCGEAPALTTIKITFHGNFINHV